MAAKSLGWKLLDRNLIDKIARMAGVDLESARACDEHVDPWLHRISKPLWRSGLQVAATLTPVDIFDAESMARLTREVVDQAYESGDCVIVGRGAQCILQGRDDVFHVFVEAPWAERVCRIQQRLHVTDEAPRLIRQVDEERAAYVRLYFGQDWANPHLYDMIISSRPGCQAVASTIVCAMSQPR